MEFYDRETLKTLSLSQLYSLSQELKSEVSATSQRLVHALVNKDRRLRRRAAWSQRLTDILIRYALDNDLDGDLEFSVTFMDVFDDIKFHKWLNSWKIISRTKKGIPKQFRRRVWEGVATYYTRTVMWERMMPILFHSKVNDRDMEWKEGISKTAFEWDSKTVARKSVEGVLLAYSRHNTSSKFAPELCVLTALVLKLMEGEEQLSLKVMVYLLDHQLPPAYFIDQLHTITVDMAVLRDLLSFMFPVLSTHMEELRSKNSSSICRSYSTNCLPNVHDVTSYEPPLADAFSLQWLLSMFTTVLPWKALRRLFDAIVIDGTDMFLFAALTIWAIFEQDLLETRQVPDYYSKMAELGEKLKNAQLLSSINFIQVVYVLHECAEDNDDIPSIAELRHKHSPISPPTRHAPCPQPSQGGAVLVSSIYKTFKISKPQTKHNGVQIESSHKTVLSAKAECPQTKEKSFLFVNAYAADVPPGILSHYPLNISDSYMKLLKKGKTFSIDM